MEQTLRCDAVYLDGRMIPASVHISGGSVDGVSPAFNVPDKVLNSKLILVPGLVDVHVHLREPGFSYKETIATGTAAAAAGGFTTVCAMPNLNPVPDSLSGLEPQRDLISRDARVHVIPYGALTHNRAGKTPSRMEELSPFVCAFTDDGSGIQDDDVMRECMRKAKELHKLVVAHCEDLALLGGKNIHAGSYAMKTNRIGIRSESEWRQVERDLHLVSEIGCGYHICHVSTKESVALVRKAKKAGLDVTCETAPHYLMLCEDNLQEDGRFKMNPPLRAREDLEALREGICDGTVDMIATDHAPHAISEKSCGLDGSAMGVVGLETAFAELYTGLVQTGILTLEKLLVLMHDAPARRFGLSRGIEKGAPADFALFDLDKPWVVRPERFQSLGRATPFAGDLLCGKCIRTYVNGKIVYEEKREE